MIFQQGWQLLYNVVTTVITNETAENVMIRSNQVTKKVKKLCKARTDDKRSEMFTKTFARSCIEKVACYHGKPRIHCRKRNFGGGVLETAPIVSEAGYVVEVEVGVDQGMFPSSNLALRPNAFVPPK